MSRARLKKALSSHDPADPAIVPLIEAHAARLEQLADDRWRSEAEAQARMHRSAQALYGLDAVTIGAGGWLDAGSVALARDVILRLRPVLGERAGIAVVLPDAGEALTEIVQVLGSEEPELFFLLGACADSTLESLAEFYGAALVCLAAPAKGVVALDPTALLSATDSPSAWLYTTSAEIGRDADPHAVRSAIERLRRPDAL